MTDTTGRQSMAGQTEVMKELIVIDGITKTYRLGDVAVEALKGVSLSIHEEEFTIIVGRNGSGKSTLLYQLGLLDRPDSGSIYFEGREVSRISDRHRRRLRLTYLGYIFQDYALISELTALENVMVPAMMLMNRSDAGEKSKRLLERVGLGARLNHLTRQLSGGEQQKVAIARAMVNDPRVIIADEPTSNLDSVAARDVLDTFDMINSEHGHAIVMVTHEQEETVYARKLIRLSDGRTQ